MSYFHRGKQFFSLFFSLRYLSSINRVCNFLVHHSTVEFFIPTGQNRGSKKAALIEITLQSKSQVYIHPLILTLLCPKEKDICIYIYFYIYSIYIYIYIEFREEVPSVHCAHVIMVLRVCVLCLSASNCRRQTHMHYPNTRLRSLQNELRFFYHLCHFLLSETLPRVL